MKYMHQYEILNERYPINKNEKTILDLLKYGYKIDVSPDVDNSMFKKNVNIEKDKMVDEHHPTIAFKKSNIYILFYFIKIENKISYFFCIIFCKNCLSCHISYNAKIT